MPPMMHFHCPACCEMVAIREPAVGAKVAPAKRRGRPKTLTQEQRKENRLESLRKYTEANRDKINAKRPENARRYYQRNREAILERLKDRRLLAKEVKAAEKLADAGVEA